MVRTNEKTVQKRIRSLLLDESRTNNLATELGDDGNRRPFTPDLSEEPLNIFVGSIPKTVGGIVRVFRGQREGGQERDTESLAILDPHRANDSVAVRVAGCQVQKKCHRDPRGSDMSLAAVILIFPPELAPPALEGYDRHTSVIRPKAFAAEVFGSASKHLKARRGNHSAFFLAFFAPWREIFARKGAKNTKKSSRNQWSPRPA
jgi:hypothetical protein